LFLALLLSFGVFAVSAQQAPAAGAQKAATAQPITVGILALDGPFITETAGALDVYHHVPADKLKVVLISDTNKEMKTYEGMPFRAHYTIDNAPKVDVLVIPSGAGSLERDLKNQRVVDWIKKEAKGAKYVTSHCEGAFLLATAGLLEGKNATTFPTDRADLQKRFPNARIKNDRVVVDGNLVTSAGGLATYEASLWVVGQLFGAGEAKRIGDALVFGQSNVAAATPAK
jgi:transcriptional regulator GlxA family with amidase domain